MLKRNQRTLAILIATALALACSSPLSTPYAPPTFDLLQIDTIVAETAGAAATQTFVLLPTLTIAPTFTKAPSETPSPTNTFIFVLATQTPTPSNTPTPEKPVESYACEIISKSPPDDTSFVPGIVFQGRWQVKNTGTQTWGVNTADFRYVGGTKFHRTPVLDMPTSIPPGEKVDLIVEMWAPNDPDTYTTTWNIQVGKTRFCDMELRIIVT